MEKLHHTEQEFWGASYQKIEYILNKHMEDLKRQNKMISEEEMQTIGSMHSIPGW